MKEWRCGGAGETYVIEIVDVRHISTPCLKTGFGLVREAKSKCGCVREEKR